MPKIFTSKSQKIGEIGEEVACKFLMKQKYKIFERNYTRKWGELDIIAKKGQIYHLIEVKSVTHVTFNPNTKYLRKNRESFTYKGFDPIENLHSKKIKRLSRAIQTYTYERKISDQFWQFDFIIVYLDLDNKKARVEHMENLDIWN